MESESEFFLIRFLYHFYLMYRYTTPKLKLIKFDFSLRRTLKTSSWEVPPKLPKIVFFSWFVYCVIG